MSIPENKNLSLPYTDVSTLVHFQQRSLTRYNFCRSKHMLQGIFFFILAASSFLCFSYLCKIIP